MLRNRKPKKADGERMSLTSVTVRIDVESYLNYCEEEEVIPEDNDFVSWVQEFLMAGVSHEIVSKDEH